MIEPTWIQQQNTVDGWNPANQLRLVVYPIIYKVLTPSQVVVWDFWTINRWLPRLQEAEAHHSALIFLHWVPEFRWFGRWFRMALNFGLLTEIFLVGFCLGSKVVVFLDSLLIASVYISIYTIIDIFFSGFWVLWMVWWWVCCCCCCCCCCCWWWWWWWWWWCRCRHTSIPSSLACWPSVVSFMLTESKVSLPFNSTRGFNREFQATLRKTNIAMGNQRLKMYLLFKMVVFHGYVSLREGTLPKANMEHGTSTNHQFWGSMLISGSIGIPRWWDTYQIAWLWRDHLFQSIMSTTLW